MKKWSEAIIEKSREIVAKNQYKRPKWSIGQAYRMSGLVEDLCEHGVGHPNKEWLKKHDPDGKLRFGVHGCDGCCGKDE